MNILVICQYYYPEPFKVHDICKSLVEKGNSVDVVTGIPNYPMGKIYEGYKGKDKRDEVIDGVNVHRCNIIPRGRSGVGRLLNYFSYPKEASRYLKKTHKKYDVVFVYQLSPVLMAKPAVSYKKKHKNTKVVLYCLDIWPESLKMGGIKEDSFIFKYFDKQSKKIYNGCDRILVTSRSFMNYLEEKFSISKKRMKYLPQYAEVVYDVKSCSKQPDSYFDFMFAGNMGKAQGLEMIIDAIDELRDNKTLRWHFVGNGLEYDRIRRIVSEKKLDNVFFYGYKPVDEMPNYFAKADAMLVTLKKGTVVSNTLPGKVQSYMAAGKPIIGAIDGDAFDVINNSKCGYCGHAEDLSEFVSNVRKFVNRKNWEEMSANSVLFYNKWFKKEKFINDLVRELK